MKFAKNHFHGMIQFDETAKNGRKYTVRHYRIRYFFPDEWMAFFDVLKPRQKITFHMLINTGARINEVRHICISDIDYERNSIVLRQTKSKNKDGTYKMRVISISPQFAKYLKKIAKEYNLSPTDAFPILSTPAAHIALKKALKKIGIPDWKMISVHNVRKTLETWLLALDVDSMKTAKHFGHSLAVAGKFYVSPDVFSFDEKDKMRLIIGDLYQRR